MPEDITLVLTSSIFVLPPGGVYTCNAQAWINPPRNADGPNFATTTPSTKVSNWALVLDRMDPTKPPLYQEASDASTAPSDDLLALMTPAHILVYVSGGRSTDLPQGALFTMLRQNGGGSLLKKAQQLSFFNASGMMNGLLYTLVSVPGSNLPGIENLVQSGTGDTLGPIDGDYNQAQGNIQSLYSLVSGSDGYDPTEIG